MSAAVVAAIKLQLAALGGRNKGLSMQYLFIFINLSSCPQPPAL
jgi:hypothetical protein